MIDHTDDEHLQHVNVLGVGVSVVNLGKAVTVISRWVKLREQKYVCVTGVHGIMESWRDPDLRRIHSDAGLVTPDGMPLVWLLKQAGYRDVDRVYGPDLMRAVLASGVQHGVKHFLYGSSPKTLEALERNLLAAFPAVRIVGTHSPPIRPVGADEDDIICDLINSSGADIVWIGLSTPKQEVWMARHRRRLQCPVLIGVGAAFDIHAGIVPQAPRLVQRSGFEWLFRLLQEPRRLAGRYLRNNPLFVLLILKQKIGL